MGNNSMLRPPLSSTIFPRPNTSRRIRTNVISMENESTRLHDIEIRIERTRGHCSMAYGRQEKAYIKVINQLEKERLEILKDTKEKSCNNTNDSCTE
jgi:hypothetical protein